MHGFENWAISLGFLSFSWNFIQSHDAFKPIVLAKIFEWMDYNK